MNETPATGRTTNSPAAQSESSLDQMLLKRRRNDVLVLVAAHRAALAAYKQHVEHSIERVEVLLAAAESWAVGGEVPELATRYAATAKAAWNEVCESREAAGCACTHCVADTAEFTDLGFGYADFPAQVALGWVTGYVHGSCCDVGEALGTIHDAFRDETNDSRVAEKVSDAAYAAARRAAALLAREHKAA